jgi:hypothetical protein
MRLMVRARAEAAAAHAAVLVWLCDQILLLDQVDAGEADGCVDHGPPAGCRWW